MAIVYPPRVGHSTAPAAPLADDIDAPAEIVPYAKERHGLDITPAQASTYKSLEKKRSSVQNGGGGRKRAGRKAARASASAGSKAGNGLVASGSLDMVDAMIAVKELCCRFGADKVRKMVGLFE
jgi:hypothetical protein